MLMYFFAGFFESHPVYDQTQGYGAVFVLLYGQLYYNSITNLKFQHKPKYHRSKILI
jgi:hypothetical protein